MILAADIGNTHIQLGCIDDKGVIRGPVQMSTDRVETAFEYAAEIRQVLDLIGVCGKDLDGSIISSVVPNVTTSVASAFKILTGREPYILGQNIDSGLAVDMDGITADQIAGDLVATAVAAREEYMLPAIIIDIGTATTVTVVDKRGVYIGGCIMPGPGTTMKGMLERTSLLPAIDFSTPERVIAKDTVDAMKSGIMYGSAGALDGIIDRYTEELKKNGDLKDGDPTVIATGGMGKIIAPFCRHKIILDEHLLLKGLWLIWKLNQHPVR
ncbi:MAG: type III pantothenate kinase [Eubacteriales bacterium]|jgi:type III pantothenate kinase